MISGVYMHCVPCWFPDFVVRHWRNVEGRSEMRQVRKGGKSEREAILRVDKNTRKQYANRADLSSITAVTRF